MNQFFDSTTKKLLYGFLGFGVPAILLLMQAFLGWGTLPLMIITLTWFGLALFLYLGLSEDETLN
jgi:hypothetical protein